jgi:hypothetical protein
MHEQHAALNKPIVQHDVSAAALAYSWPRQKVEMRTAQSRHADQLSSWDLPFSDRSCVD